MNQINQAEQDYIDNYDKKSVVIIGAGPCGVVNLRYVKEKLNAICIDCKDELGGQWHYDKYTEATHPNLQQNAFYNQTGYLPSSLYENLIANVPKPFMQYKDFPARNEFDEFMKAEQFHQYLLDYSQKHDLKKRMVFNTYVSSVRLVKNLTNEEIKKVGFEINKKFLIEITNAADYTKDTRYLQADSILVANGHFSVPYYPPVKNADLFQGIKLHVHTFRQRSINEYKDKHLVIYGSSLSSQDIVYIFLRKLPINQRPSKITVIGNDKSIALLRKSIVYQEEIKSGLLQYVSPYIKEFDSSNSLVLESGQQVQNIDILLYATGYQFSYPFFDNKKDNLVDIYVKREKQYSFGPLYLKMVCVREPDIIFLGIIQNILSRQQAIERQAILTTKILTGEIKLPSQEEMQQDFEKDYQEAIKYYQDGKEYLKVSFDNGINEMDEFKMQAELCKIPIDAEYNNYVMKYLLPLFVEAAFGNYANLKTSNVSSLLPSNYYPKAGYF